ncbi:DDE-type integrase/transposase/recombinase [Rhizobium ruizarguesonis]|uniref:DDE-type integrase/transposase/recombinase n=1 Tax=Rhizobium ruizarguesonis TaxID=2081791 RepID=UPI0037C4F3E9
MAGISRHGRCASGCLVFGLSTQLWGFEEMFGERGFEVDHSTVNRWVLAHAPIIEKRLRQFRRPHFGSVRIDETYAKIRGNWRYLRRQTRKSGRLPSETEGDLDVVKRLFRKMLKDEPLL